MGNFCPNCGAKLKTKVKFCASCGTTLSKVVSPPPPPLPPPPPPPPPPPSKSAGCGAGCFVGCLIAIIAFIIIVGLLVLGIYLFFRSIKNGKEPGEYFSVERSDNPVECEDSLSCLENNFKKCSPAVGETELGEFATADFEVIGPKNNSCVIYFKITELKELPSEAEWIPQFVLDSILEDLSMECLIPSSVYEKGVEGFTSYIEDNMRDVCKGPLFDVVDKFGIEI